MKAYIGAALAAVLVTAGTISALPKGARAAAPAARSVENELVGVWTLDYADFTRSDGSRGHDYGEKPVGLLIIDSSGYYSSQILDTARPKFAAGDKAKGTPDEYRSALLGASSTFGKVTVDKANHALIFSVDGSAYPNAEGKSVTRLFTLSNGILINKQAAARPNGDVPVTEWRRVK